MERRARAVRLTPAGRSLLAFAGAGILASTAFGGMIGLIPAAALAFLSLAFVTTWVQGRSVEPVAVGRLVCFAGDEATLRVELRNRSPWLPVRDLALSRGDFSRKRPRPNALLSELPKGTVTTAEYVIKRNERGHHRIFDITLSSTYPLGLAEFRASFRLPADHLVLPRLGTVRPIAERLSRRRGIQLEARRTLLGSEEFYGLREWRDGESQRLVHWKVSARRGKLMVRELRGEDRPPVHLMLFTHLLGPPIRRHPGFEVAVSLTATLCEHLLRERFRLRLSLVGSARPSFELGRGRASLLDVLAELATIRPSFGGDPGSARAWLQRLDASGEVGIAVTADGSLAGRTSSPRGGVLTLDAYDPNLEEIFSRLRRNDGLSLLSRAGALE